MKPQAIIEQSWNGRSIRIAASDPTEQAQRIQDAVARRAYQFFHTRQVSSDHQLEDWQRAESEIVRPLGCGYLVLYDKISLNTDVSVFEEGLLELYPEPRRLMIRAKPKITRQSTGFAPNDPEPWDERIFFVVDLPVRIDPTRVTAKFNGRILEIDLVRAAQKVLPWGNAA